MDEPAATTDGGHTILPCPACGYDLRGLVERRCPECGRPFTPRELVRRPIPFEVAVGWRLIPAFLLTALMSLFAPLRLARRTVPAFRNARALWFGGICFAATFLAMISGADWEFMAAWMCAAVVCVLTQALLLTLLDRDAMNGFGAAYLHWIGVGGWTSAVMLTEFYWGPPRLLLSDIAEFVRDPRLPHAVPDLEELVLTSQVFIWAASVALCFVVHRGKHWTGVWRVAVWLFLLAACIVLYGAVVEHVGMRVYEWLDDWHPFKI